MELDEEYTKIYLMKLGLTEYEARIYTILVKMGQQTASELSFLGKVPRSKIYGSAKNLEAKGFVKIIPTKPERYTAVSPTKVLLPLLDKLVEDNERCRKVLETLAKSYESSKFIHLEEPYVLQELLTVQGRENVQNRISKMIDDARDSIFIVTSSNGAIRVHKLYYEAFEKVTERNIGIRIIAPRTSENESALKELKEIVKVKTTDLPLPRYVCMDTKEIFFVEARPDDHNIREGRDVGSWTSDSLLVKIHRESFLKLWQIL